LRSSPSGFKEKNLGIGELRNYELQEILGFAVLKIPKSLNSLIYK